MHKVAFKTQSLTNQWTQQTDKSNHVCLLRDVVRQIPKRRIQTPRRLRTIAKSDSYQEPAVIANSSEARLETSQVHMIRLAEHLFGPVIPPIHRFQPLVSACRTVDTELPHEIHRSVSPRHKVHHNNNNNTVKRVLSASPEVHSGFKGTRSGHNESPHEFEQSVSPRPKVHNTVKRMLSVSPQVPDEFMRTSSRTDEFRSVKFHDEFMRTRSRTDEVRSVSRPVSPEFRRDHSISPDSLCGLPPGRRHHTVGAQAHGGAPSPPARLHYSYSPDFWDGDGRTGVHVMSRIQKDFLRFRPVAKNTGLYSQSFL
jgi:hypothetical protein